MGYREKGSFVAAILTIYYLNSKPNNGNLILKISIVDMFHFIGTF